MWLLLNCTSHLLLTETSSAALSSTATASNEWTKMNQVVSSPSRRGQFCEEGARHYHLLLGYTPALLLSPDRKVWAHFWRRVWARRRRQCGDTWLTHSIYAIASSRCSPRSWTETESWWRARRTAETPWAHLKESRCREITDRPVVMRAVGKEPAEIHVLQVTGQSYPFHTKAGLMWFSINPWSR